jgi:hypothetical protein
MKINPSTWYQKKYKKTTIIEKLSKKFDPIIFYANSLNQIGPH